MTPASDLGDARVAAARPAPARALPSGTRLRDYEITATVGESAIGVVYAAWDHSLQRKVAVKEYMPASLASRSEGSPLVAVRSQRQVEAFRAGLTSFVDEARLLARFDHPSLIKVYRFWEENGTACMAMPFHDGPTLTTALAALGHVPGEAELRAWLKPILNAVTVLHAGRTWHRNIAPDKIVLTPVGPVLLGFGAAARAVAAAGNAPAAALAAGFAAPEQYGADADSACGPWTDLYSLAAVVYGAIAGAPPDVATDRLTGDFLQPLSQVAAGLYGAGFLAAVDAALALRPQDRPQDHETFRALMVDMAAPATMSLAPPRDLMLEPFLGDLDSQRQVTVPDRPLLAPAEPASAPAPAAARKGPLPAPSRTTDPASPDGGRAAPAWMKGAGAGAVGKRALYGVVAATCACIGIAALALQFYLRPPARGPAATSSAAAATPTPAVVASPTNAPTTAPTAAPTIAPIAASTAPGTAGERQARCIDILQKASLEKISAADTEFFKKECK